MNNQTGFYQEPFVSFLTLVVLLFCCSAFLGCSETAEIVKNQTPEEDQTAGMVEAVIEEPPPVEPVPEGMVLIPAGEFQMGSNDEDAKNDEQPVHTVYVDAFYMDTHEVTNFDFQRFVIANPEWRKDSIPDALHDGYYLHHWTGNNYPIGKANHPATYVSWYAAVAYAKWVGKRLPTEAEWEKAARGSLEGQKYPRGNRIDSGKANYAGRIGDTTPVGRYSPNGYGLYDMSGNVWEWCLDAYNIGFYSVSPVRNPLSAVNTVSNVDLILNDWTNVKSYRVMRGGCWSNDARFVRCANRNYYPPTYQGCRPGPVGFRCVKGVTSDSKANN